VEFEIRKNGHGALILTFGRLDVTVVDSATEGKRLAKALGSEPLARSRAVRIEGAIKVGVERGQLSNLVANAVIRGKCHLSCEIGTLDSDGLALWDRVHPDEDCDDEA